ncbi:MAG: DNA polymerase III subunit beta [Chitinophagaceae bacterium]
MKKLVISSDSISAAMKKLALAVNSKSILPILRNVYCKVNKGGVQFITSDQEITISYTCEADTEGAPFEMLIPFDFLNKVSGLLKGEPIAIELPSTRKAKITGSDDIFELNSLDKLDEYPEVPAVPKKNRLKLEKGFIDLLSKSMDTCAKDAAIEALQFSCLDIQEKEINLVSTDTMALFKMKIEAEPSSVDQLLLSSKIASAIDGIGDMELSWSQKQMAFVGEKISVWATRHEGKYPNYKAIIPKYDWNLTLERSVLVKALKKACLSSNETKRTVLDFKSQPGKLHFETDDTELARRIEVNIPADFTGDVIKMAIHAGKLLTMMGQINTNTIRLAIDNPEKAIIVTSEENENYLGLIIPFKIGN